MLLLCLLLYPIVTCADLNTLIETNKSDLFDFLNLRLSLLDHKIDKLQEFVHNMTHILYSQHQQLKSDLGALIEKITNNPTSDCAKSAMQYKIPQIFEEPTKSNCEDLDVDQPSGIYQFSGVANRKFCTGRWTTIQNRGYDPRQRFDLNWSHYKRGFGNLSADFWFGNDFIHQLTTKQEQILRVEIEDFEGNVAWAQYETFKVHGDKDNYRIIVGDYSGNASDSLSSHNGSMFSTFDRKNDQAPECCPCSVSYGGGWWFNSCMECNLNGNYQQDPTNSGYFQGIIWEGWLGNYSLKKSRMMVKPKTSVVHYTVNTESYENYEDP